MVAQAVLSVYRVTWVDGVCFTVRAYSDAEARSFGALMRANFGHGSHERSKIREVVKVGLVDSENRSCAFPWYEGT